MNRILFEPEKQRQFLKQVLMKLNLSKKEFSKKFKLNVKTFDGYFYENFTLPELLFSKIIEECPHLSNYKKSIKLINENWGQRKGGLARISKIKNIDAYMKSLHDKARSKAKKVKHLKDVQITSKVCTFVREQKIDPLPLISVMLLTDGYVCSKKSYSQVCFSSKSDALSRIFIELVRLWRCKINISQYRNKNGVLISYFSVPKNNVFFEFSPSFKKSPAPNESKEEYLSKVQPTVSFLDRYSEKLKILAIRIAFSTEGSISFNITKEIYVEPILNLSCSNPQLCLEWKKLLESLDLDFNIDRNKNKWSGISGLRTFKINNIKKFIEFGGFIEGVEISDKSRHFSGMEKNKVLDMILKKEDLLTFINQIK